jgi:hypothetical protein
VGLAELSNISHDVLQPIAAMKPVDPLAVQVGQCVPVLGQGQRLGLEPPHLRGRGSLRIDGTVAHDLAHDRIKSETVGIVDILVSGQSPELRLLEQPVKPMDRVLAASGVAWCCSRQIEKPERVIKFAHHKQAAVRTELRTPELHLHTRVKMTRSARCEPAPSG